MHKQGLTRRFILTPDRGVTFDRPPPQYQLDKFEPLECPAGTLVLLHVSAPSTLVVCCGGVLRQCAAAVCCGGLCPAASNTGHMLIMVLVLVFMPWT